VAIAPVTAREAGLPQVRLAAGAAADLRTLLDYREQLVEERTRLGNPAHVELASLRPGYHVKIPAPTQAMHREAARRLLCGDHRVRADLTRRRLTRVRQLDAEIKESTAVIGARVEDSAAR
jgi:transposase